MEFSGGGGQTGLSSGGGGGQTKWRSEEVEVARGGGERRMTGYIWTSLSSEHGFITSGGQKLAKTLDWSAESPSPAAAFCRWAANLNLLQHQSLPSAEV